MGYLILHSKAKFLFYVGTSAKTTFDSTLIGYVDSKFLSLIPTYF